MNVIASDPSVTLPTEIQSLILDPLRPKDIVSLWLVSRAFWQLPKALFKRLIREDMSQFWEIYQVEEDEVMY